MIFLLLAIFTSTLIILFFRLFTRFKVDNITAITVNYLVASVLGFWLSSGTHKIGEVFQQDGLFLAIGSGFLLMATFLIYAYSTQRSGVAITSVSGKMSVILPVLLGFIWYHEAVTWNKVPAILLALTAFVLILFKKGEKIKAVFYIFPVLLFFGNGLNDALFKIAEEEFIQGEPVFFLATAFTVSLFLGLVVLVIRAVSQKKFPNGRSILAGVVLGLLNWYSTYFFLEGLHFFDVSVFVPVFNASIVLLGAGLGFVIFKEKLKPLNWVGVVLALVAIALLAL